MNAFGAGGAVSDHDFPFQVAYASTIDMLFAAVGQCDVSIPSGYIRDGYTSGDSSFGKEGVCGANSVVPRKGVHEERSARHSHMHLCASQPHARCHARVRARAVSHGGADIGAPVARRARGG